MEALSIFCAFCFFIGSGVGAGIKPELHPEKNPSLDHHFLEEGDAFFPYYDAEAKDISFEFKGFLRILDEDLFAYKRDAGAYDFMGAPEAFEIVNRNGQTVVEGLFINPLPFSEGISCYYKDGETIFIGRDFEPLPQFEPIKGLTTDIQVEDGLVKVDNMGGVFVFDKNGQLIDEQKTYYLRQENEFSEKTVSDFRNVSPYVTIYYRLFTEYPNEYYHQSINDIIYDYMLSYVRNNTASRIIIRGYFVTVGNVLTIVKAENDHSYYTRAHDSIITTMVIDAVTGESYTLEDLFQADVDYTKYVKDPLVPIDAFVMTRTGVVFIQNEFHYSDREEVLLPYFDLMDDIDQQGPLWQAIKDYIETPGDKGYEEALEPWRQINYDTTIKG